MPNTPEITKIESRRQSGFTSLDEIEVTIAPNAGACFGVVRALKLGHQAANQPSSSPVFAFGPLVHNPLAISELESQGVKIENDSDKIDSGTVILRSHGVKQEVEADFKKRGLNIVDATCPLVKKPQRIASGLSKKGYFLVLVGDAKHPEVQGVVSYFGKSDYLVTYSSGDIAKIPESVTKVGLLAQTTIEYRVFEEIVARCKERFKDVLVYNTICDATSVRQNEAHELAKSADVMIVVGGRNSSNTTKLVKICEGYETPTYLIEEKSEIKLDWLRGKRKVGVTGGASTPQEYVDQVGEYIANLIQLDQFARPS